MVVIIGILAAIAIPKFGNTKEKAIVTAYALGPAEPGQRPGDVLGPEPAYYGGVIPDLPTSSTAVAGRLDHFVSATPAGWSAKATAPGLTGQTCAIFYGDAPPIPPATVDAAVACT